MDNQPSRPGDAGRSSAGDLNQMAGFSDSPETYDRVDWTLLQNGPINLYFRSDLLNQDSHWLEEHGYAIHTFDASCWHDEIEMHVSIQSALSFPDYYGRNLDALNDCLSDFAISNDGGMAFVIFHFDTFADRHPTVANALLDIITDNSRRALLFGQRMIALLQTDTPDFRTGPLGATTGNWNRHEWLTSTRARKADEQTDEREPE
ncbi:barstar family protein [Crateriforma conspicua]|nr:barstar family protein [Crateriforma conspicua]